MAAHNESITFQTTEHAKTIVKDLTKRLGMKQTTFLERLLEWFGARDAAVQEWILRRNPSLREVDLLELAVAEVRAQMGDTGCRIVVPPAIYVGLQAAAERKGMTLERYLERLSRPPRLGAEAIAVDDRGMGEPKVYPAPRGSGRSRGKAGS